MQYMLELLLWMFVSLVLAGVLTMGVYLVLSPVGVFPYLVLVLFLSLAGGGWITSKVIAATGWGKSDEEDE